MTSENSCINSEKPKTNKIARSAFDVLIDSEASRKNTKSKLFHDGKIAIKANQEEINFEKEKPVEILLQTEKSCLKMYHFIEIQNLLEVCVEEISDKLILKPEIKVYGKIVHQNRNVGFFSEESVGYRYSGQIMKSQPLEKNLKNLLCLVNVKLKAKFNGILVNEYVDGKDYIGQHADDESALDKDAGVVTISYGVERIFRITKNSEKNERIRDFSLKNGSMYQMCGEFQKEFKHGIPVQSKVLGKRISFTLRYHLE